jgi:zinc D-Ala-D-Ala carboxypeptidase
MMLSLAVLLSFNIVSCSKNIASDDTTEFTTVTKSEDIPVPPQVSQNPIGTDNTCPARAKANVNGLKVIHYQYDEVNPADLVRIKGESNFKLHKDAAKAYEQMRNDAKKSNVNLRIVSSFRSRDNQQTNFNNKLQDVKRGKRTLADLYTFNSVPGYSEHHTGYAADFNSTSPNFAKSKEYQYLVANAKKYGFELSFPKNNHQHIGFEPWHWRFVGNDKFPSSQPNIFCYPQSQERS